MKTGILLLLCFSSAFAKPVEKIEANEIILVSENNCVKNNYNLNCSNYTINNNATCVLCKTLVSTIDYGIIKGNQTIQEITQVLKDICCMIHGPSGYECIIVLNNIQDIIKYISNGLTNIQICRKLHLCS
jgi:hypothetical protein